MPGTSASGARRLPKALKELRGTVDPRWSNDEEPVTGTDQLQFIPDALGEKAREHWATIRPMLVDAGIAQNTDRMALIVLCTLIAEWFEIDRRLQQSDPVIRAMNGAYMKNPLFEIKNQIERRLRPMLVEFGMTPSARTKVRAVGAKPKQSGKYGDV